jgi:acyl phosphate:glycerol-3-phosphate acyltransferase
MSLLTRTVHVLALGLWFGTSIFFTFVVGLTLFGTFEKIAVEPAASRPLWFPVPAEFEKAPPGKGFPDPLRKEQGSRAFGAAVGPLFPWFFGIQAACGCLTLLTALAWYGRRQTVHKVRAVVLVLALATVAGGWWLERIVENMRVVRNDLSDVVLRSPQPASEEVKAAEDARADFGRFHSYSLMLNFVTVGLVTVAMALAAQMPARNGPEALTAPGV